MLLEDNELYRFKVKDGVMHKLTILTAVFFLSLSSLSMAGVVIVDDNQTTKTEKEKQDKQRNERESTNNRDSNDSQSSQSSQSDTGKNSNSSQRKKPNTNLIFGF